MCAAANERAAAQERAVSGTMEVLALASFPIEAAATRYRLAQLVPALEELGINVTVRPFLDSKSFMSIYQPPEWRRTMAGLANASYRRIADIRHARAVDVLLVQREAAILGPPVAEWLAMHYGRCPLVLDLDDPTYISYVSPTYSHLARWLKWSRKTDQLIKWASLVTCGNRTIADYVAASGTPTRVIPTVVDLDFYTPRPKPSSRDDVPVIGWIGSHSTYPFLESLAPVLQDLAKTHRFRLKVVGSGRDHVSFPGVDVENLRWSLDRELEDFRSLDIGLYPIIPDPWSIGKSGLKSIIYMAVGVPFVASPVGAVAEIGEPGVTHLRAATPEEWRDGIGRLLVDADLRCQMGRAGREYAVRHYTISRVAKAFAQALTEAVGG